MNITESLSNATPSAFGWEFQCNLGLYFAAKNLKNLKKIKIEGLYEDIELYFEDGSMIFIQAKAQSNPFSTKNTTDHMKKAFKTLLNTSNNTKYKQLYYGSNIENPFVLKEFNSLFSNGVTEYQYNSLNEKLKDKIIKIVTTLAKDNNKDITKFDYSKLSIIRVPFNGDNKDTRYRYIKDEVDILLGTFNFNKFQINQIFKEYQLLFSQNASMKVHIEKEEFGWPIVLSILEHESSSFYNEYDISHSEEEDIEQHYNNFISRKVTDFSIFNKVIKHYKDFIIKNSISNFPKRQMLNKFVDENFKNYCKEFFHDKFDESYEAVTKLILWKIIKQFKSIEKVKNEVGI